ncbi:hypothetical protein MHU86_4213 [Fragilaria crotonensis]|nr:hypothetical protein MHU86_4213 [Fragilaria crotonensis]
MATLPRFTSPRWGGPIDGDMPMATHPQQSLQHHSERWRHMSELAGSHRQDDSVLKLQRPIAPLAFRSGVPPQVAARIRTLHIVPQSNLAEWLDVLRTTCFELEHLYLERVEGDGEEQSYSEEETCMRRLYILCRLPDLKSIDGEHVTDEERQLARPDWKEWVSDDALLIDDGECDSQGDDYDDDDRIGDVGDAVEVSQYGVVKRTHTDPQHDLHRVHGKAQHQTKLAALLPSPGAAGETWSAAVAPASSYLARFGPLHSLCSRSDKYLPAEGHSFEIDNPHRFQELPLPLPTKELRTLMQQKNDAKRKSEPSSTFILKTTPERMSFLPKPNKDTPPRPLLTVSPISPGAPRYEGSSTDAIIMSPSRSLASPFPMQFITRPSAAQALAAATPIPSGGSTQSANDESRGRADSSLSPSATSQPPSPKNLPTDSDLTSPSARRAPYIRWEMPSPVDSDPFEIHKPHQPQESPLQSPAQKSWKQMQTEQDPEIKSKPSPAPAETTSPERTIFLPSLDTTTSPRFPSTPLSIRPGPALSEVSPTEASIMSPSRSLTSPFPMQFRMRPFATQSLPTAAAVSPSSRMASEDSPGSFDAPQSPMTTQALFPKKLPSRFSPLNVLCSRNDKYLPDDGHSFEIENPHRLQQPLLHSPSKESKTPIIPKEDPKVTPEPSATLPTTTLLERVQFRPRPTANQSLSATAVAAPMRFVMEESRGTIDAPLSPKGIMLPYLPKKFLSKDDRPPPCPGRVALTTATTLHAKPRKRMVGRLRHRSHIRSTSMLDEESDDEDDEVDELHMD